MEDRKPITIERVKAALKEVSEIINQAGNVCLAEEQQELACQFRDILSAIRGPDEDDSHSLKRQTTAKIRWAIGIREGSGLDVSLGFGVRPTAHWSMDFNNPGGTCNSAHFADHIARAALSIEEIFGPDVWRGKEVPYDLERDEVKSS